MQIWYKRKGDAEGGTEQHSNELVNLMVDPEKTLQHLLKQQRNKLEEIKKKTNYYSMRDLLQRYDEPVSSPGPRQRIFSAPTPTQPSTPQRPMPQNPNGRLQTPHQLGSPLIAVSPPAAPVPAVPPRKQWYDKLADALLGDDDTPNVSASRYALICEQCFAHNGLVKESMWEDARTLFKLNISCTGSPFMIQNMSVLNATTSIPLLDRRS